MNDIMVPIDKAGRVVLPKAVREELAIHPGDVLKVSINGTDVVLRPKKQGGGLVRHGKALIFTSDTHDLLKRDDVEQILAADRKERETAMTRGLSHPKRK